MTDTTTGQPIVDPTKTTTGGSGTDGHYEGNGAPTTTTSDGTDGTDGQPEGNGPKP